jgi:uncharacterized protein (TIGR00255 family)
MIRSMTGYGQGSAELSGLRITVELRAVNNRFADLRFRIPTELASQERGLRRRILERVQRGRVDLSLAVERPGNGELRPAINRALLDEVVASRDALRQSGVPGELDLNTLLSIPGMFKLEPTTAAWGEPELRALGRALDAALDALDDDRRREGEAIRHDLMARVAEMERLTAAIRERAAALPGEVRKRLQARVEKLAAGVALDPGRLEQEALLLAERADVTEEVVRLEGHLQQARRLLERSDGEPLGKRIEFLLQEVHRETNTVASKSADLELSRSALALKAEAEKVREQIQNVE